LDLTFHIQNYSNGGFAPTSAGQSVYAAGGERQITVGVSDREPSIAQLVTSGRFLAKFFLPSLALTRCLFLLAMAATRGYRTPSQRR
jgi:hypothetical protein